MTDKRERGRPKKYTFIKVTVRHKDDPVEYNRQYRTQLSQKVRQLMQKELKKKRMIKN